MWSAVCTWRWNRILCKYPNQIHIWSSTVLSKSFTFWKSREPKPAASLSSCGRRAWDSQPERCHPFLIYFHFSTKKKREPLHPRSCGTAHTFIRSRIRCVRPAEFVGAWGWCYRRPFTVFCALEKFDTMLIKLTNFVDYIYLNQSL